MHKNAEKFLANILQAYDRFLFCRTNLTDFIQESQAEVGTKVKFVQEKEGYFQFEGWSERWFPEIGTGG